MLKIPAAGRIIPNSAETVPHFRAKDDSLTRAILSPYP